LVEDQPVGLLGLANKPGGFTDADAQVAGGFGEIAAVALLNSRTLASLEASEAKFHTLFDNAADAILIHDLEGHFLEVNQVACRRLGYSRGELLEMTPMDIDAPAYAALVPERMEMVYQRGRALFETVHVCQDGTQIPIELNCRIIDYAGVPAVLSIARDITERKRTEEALARSNADLERFAYVVSHDLREPLRAVSHFLELLDQRYAGQLDEKAQTFIGYAVDGAERMGKLIDGLLAYAQVSSRPEIGPTDCEALFAQVTADLELAIEEHGAVVTHDPLPTVPVDPVQMRQLLQNLIDNGIKFHATDPPRVHVSARQRTVSSLESGGTTHEWLFSVRDNGIGIDPEQQERIFAIFQRLHTPEEFPGVGIGLAICKRIVDRHDGQMWVESTPNAGSTFYFTLPDRGEV
jgi:PAS domain S-box-containing protein